MNAKRTRRAYFRNTSTTEAQAPWLEALENRLFLSAYTVTTLGDGTGTVTPAGTGKFNATTLRAAITAANAHVGADTINFSAAVAGTINLGSVLPKFVGPITVSGPGASKLSIRRNTSTAFSILSVNPGVVASVSGLTLTNGAGTKQADGSVFGGGVYNAGSLTLSNCVLSGNSAVGSDGKYATSTVPATDGRNGLGGGIYSTGTLTLSGTSLTTNRAVGGMGGDRYSSDAAGNGGVARGGGIFAAAGTVTISGGSLASNTAAGGSGGYALSDDGLGGNAFGGAIETLAGVTLKMTGATVSNNTAAGGAGSGVFASNGAARGGGLTVGGVTALASCNITGNTATGLQSQYARFNGSGGGGVYNAGALTVSGGTLSNNKATGASAEGGGVFNAARVRFTADLLTISGNSATSAGGANFAAAGGGIQNLGVAVVTRSSISSNKAVGSDGSYEDAGGSGADAFGGGIANGAGASLTLSTTTLSGNTATGGFGVQGSTDIGPGSTGDGGNGFGGGVSNAGTATLSSCTLGGNTARGGSGGRRSFSNSDSGGWGGGAVGGGIASTGNLALLSSTLAGNIAIGGVGGEDETSEAGGGGGSAWGAGLYAAGVATVKNSTLYGNTATGGAGAGARDFGGAGGNGSGGGVYLASGTLGLTHCTVTANRTYGGSGGSGSKAGKNGSPIGGGLRVQGGAATLANSLVAGNFAGSTTASDVSGTVQSASSYNVIGVGGAGGMINGQMGNKTGVSLTSLKLGTLASNGGPTKTVALLAGSVAINAGSNTVATNAKLYADQRGLVRLVGTKVDIGAFEVQASGGASIAGTFFNDTSKDGARQSTEPVLVGWQVYLDQNKNGVYDAGEINTFTSSAGTYRFAGLSAGTYRVYEVRQEGWTRTKPAGAYPLGYYDVTLAVNQAVVGKDFGNYLG